MWVIWIAVAAYLLGIWFVWIAVAACLLSIAARAAYCGISEAAADWHAQRDPVIPFDPCSPDSPWYVDVDFWLQKHGWGMKVRRDP